jgi:predicted enzyme related to lactoylglutathione lyase
MGNPVIHFEVSGSDGTKLQKFYGDLFDWKINADNPMDYGIVDNGGEGSTAASGRAPTALT